MEPITMMLLCLLGRGLFRWLNSDEGQHAVATAVTVAELAWSTISNWLQGNRVQAGDCGTLIRQKLENGNFRVVGGVFGANRSQHNQAVWECTDMDSELKHRFSGKDEITVKL